MAKTPKAPTMLAVGRRRGFETTVQPSTGSIVRSTLAPALTLDGGGQTVTGFTPDSGYFASGSVQHGEIMTITGSGFGTKAQAAPVLWDFGDEVYENGVQNTKHADTPVSSAIPRGDESDGDIYTTVSGLEFTSSGLRHSRLGRCYRSTGGDNGFVKNPYCTLDGATTSSPTEQWYVSWRQRFSDRVASSVTDANNSGGAYMGSLKTLRWGKQPGFRCVNRINASPVLFWAWLDGASEVRSANANPHPRMSQVASLEGGTKWYLSEFKTWRRNDGLMGGSEFWDLIYGSHWDVTNQQTSFSENMEWSIEALGMDATVAGGLITYFGEIYYDNSTKRIVIGDGSTWETCTGDGIELQRPTVWNNSQLSFAVNHGALSLAGKYLYWVETNSSGVDVGTRLGVFT